MESSALRPSAVDSERGDLRCPRRRRHTRPVRTAWHAIGSDRVHVGGVQALRALLHLVLDLRALRERPKAAAGDRGMVDEHVLALVVGRDEAKPLLVAEPLHGPSGHPRTSGCPSAALPTDVRTACAEPTPAGTWPAVGGTPRGVPPSRSLT